MDSPSIRVAGCSHHASDVRVREQLAFCRKQATRFLTDFHDRYPNGEAVLLSTCNRTEFYTVVHDGDWGPSVETMKQMLAKACGLERHQLDPHLFDHSGSDAVRHLFCVTASLDSMVIGETEILGQVRQAYQLASQLQRRMPVTHRLFQTAFRVARRVATETDLQANRVSIPGIAIGGFARQILGDLVDKTILVIGAGKMATETLKYVSYFGGRQITVINRTFKVAREIADVFGGEAASWEQLDSHLAAADLIISTTGSATPIVTERSFRAIQAARNGRPLFVLDLAIPRDVEPGIGRRENVHLYSMDHLQAECEKNHRARQDCLPRAKEIVANEANRWIVEMADRFQAFPGKRYDAATARVGSPALLSASS